ncbi:hypothetical protein CHUAL_011930 [Chamberlinius hualienensis]
MDSTHINKWIICAIVILYCFCVSIQSANWQNLFNRQKYVGGLPYRKRFTVISVDEAKSHVKKQRPNVNDLTQSNGWLNKHRAMVNKIYSLKVKYSSTEVKSSTRTIKVDRIFNFFMANRSAALTKKIRKITIREDVKKMSEDIKIPINIGEYTTPTDIIQTTETTVTTTVNNIKSTREEVTTSYVTFSRLNSVGELDDKGQATAIFPTITIKIDQINNHTTNYANGNSTESDNIKKVAIEINSTETFGTNVNVSTNSNNNYQQYIEIDKAATFENGVDIATYLSSLTTTEYILKSNEKSEYHSHYVNDTEFLVENIEGVQPVKRIFQHDSDGWFMSSHEEQSDSSRTIDPTMSTIHFYPINPENKTMASYVKSLPTDDDRHIHNNLINITGVNDSMVLFSSNDKPPFVVAVNNYNNTFNTSTGNLSFVEQIRLVKPYSLMNCTVIMVNKSEMNTPSTENDLTSESSLHVDSSISDTTFTTATKGMVIDLDNNSTTESVDKLKDAIKNNGDGFNKSHLKPSSDYEILISSVDSINNLTKKRKSSGDEEYAVKTSNMSLIEVPNCRGNVSRVVIANVSVDGKLFNIDIKFPFNALNETYTSLKFDSFATSNENNSVKTNTSTQIIDRNTHEQLPPTTETPYTTERTHLLEDTNSLQFETDNLTKSTDLLLVFTTVPTYDPIDLNTLTSSADFTEKSTGKILYLRDVLELSDTEGDKIEL